MNESGENVNVGVVSNVSNSSLVTANVSILYLFESYPNDSHKTSPPTDHIIENEPSNIPNLIINQYEEEIELIDDCGQVFGVSSIIKSYLNKTGDLSLNEPNLSNIESNTVNYNEGLLLFLYFCIKYFRKFLFIFFYLDLLLASNSTKLPNIQCITTPNDNNILMTNPISTAVNIEGIIIQLKIITF